MCGKLMLDINYFELESFLFIKLDIILRILEAL